ncbi:MAG: hypothetical protein U1F66_08305 [bacterium]
MFASRRDRRFPNINHFFAAMTLCSLLACGGSGSGPDFSTQALGGGFAPGEVRPINFDGSNQARIEFSELSGSEKFAVVFFGSNAEGGSFDFRLSGLDDPAQAKFLQAPTLPNPAADEEVSADTDGTSLLHERLRAAEQELEGLEPYSPENAGAGPVTKDFAASHTACGGGRGIYFNVLSSLSNNNLYETVCGVEVRRSGGVIYYIDEAVLNDLSANDLGGILNEFEAKIPHERALFGSESDVDQSGSFSVLFSPAVNRLGKSGGGFITGYFYGGDLYPRSTVQTSNEQEVLFLCVPDPSGRWNINLNKDFWSSNIAPSVLPHEYQHMISFNQHVLLRNDGAEEAWANEAISHFIEDLAPNGSLDHTGVENPSRVALYLVAPEAAAFTTGISIAQRGGSYLFFRYLYEQAELRRYPGAANGPELLRKLLQSGTKGVPNIEQATGWSFRNLLLDFFATVQLSNQGISSDPRYNLKGISLQGPQDDNRGTNLQGVQAHNLGDLPFTGQVAVPGAYFLEITGKKLMDAGQGLSFSAPAGMMAGGIVIRIQ